MTTTTRPRPRPGPTPRAASRRRPAPVRRRPGPQRDWRVEFGWRWWVLIGLFVLVLGLVALFRAPFFAIDQVQLSGEARTSEGAVLDALAIEDGQALASFDVDGAADAIAELPWVAEVQVTRGWPSTLRIRIREHVPAAAIGRGAGREWIVVSSGGRVLERRLTPPTGVPVIVAPTDLLEAARIGTVADGVGHALAVSVGLPGQLRGWVDSWTVDHDGVVAAELVGSARAVFGTETDNRTQYVSLASILDGGTSLVCISEIDLTIPDTPVVHRDPACLRAAAGL